MDLEIQVLPGGKIEVHIKDKSEKKANTELKEVMLCKKEGIKVIEDYTSFVNDG